MESHDESLPLELHAHILRHTVRACPLAAVALASTSRTQLSVMALMRPHLERSLWFVAARADDDDDTMGGLECIRIVRTAVDAVARLTSASADDECAFRRQCRIESPLRGASERLTDMSVGARLASAYGVLESASLLLIEDARSVLYAHTFIPWIGHRPCTLEIVRMGVVDLTWRSEWWLRHALVKRVAALYYVLQKRAPHDVLPAGPATRGNISNQMATMYREYRRLLVELTGRALTIDLDVIVSLGNTFNHTVLPIGIDSIESLRRSRPHLFLKDRNVLDYCRLRPLLGLNGRRLEQMSGGLLTVYDFDTILAWPYAMFDKAGRRIALNPSLRARIASPDVLSNMRCALDAIVASHVVSAHSDAHSGARTPRAVPAPFSALFDGPLFLSLCHDYKGVLLWIDMTSPAMERLIDGAMGL